MVKSKFSATYAERIYTPTLSVKLSSMPMDESEVEGLIEAAIEEGAIVYEKTLNDKSLRKDFFAHAALYRDGWEFKVVAEFNEHRNIDLLRTDNGEYWEIKSPEAKGEGKRPLRFIEGLFSDAKSQFRSHPDAPSDEVRMVVNTKYTPVSDQSIEQEIRRLLEDEKNQVVVSVVMVRKDGTVKKVK